jgi:hypothetical protein
LWWAGGFALANDNPSFGPTGNWTTVFRGNIGSDKTIVGDWTDVYRACTTPTVIQCYGGPGRPGTGGTISLRIQFDPDAMRLVFVEGTGELFNGDLAGQTQSWVPVDTDKPEPTQT